MKIKILLAAILVAIFFTRDKICDHFGFGQSKFHMEPTDTKKSDGPFAFEGPNKGNYFTNDSLYRWDDQLLSWVSVKDTEDFQALFMAYPHTENPSSQPLEIEWKVLMDIQYRLRYFEELDMEIYAPVFGKAQKTLDGKEVIIEGFVIPFDEDEELLSLSANPYASCFFCGKASPASIISMNLSNKSRRYKMDDFKKFRGTLHLNEDDPKEFYYILRDAREE